MKRTIMKMFTSVLSLGVLASCLATMPADAQVYVDVAPPAEFIATSTPVYFEGRPAYFWNNHWYYRDGGRWGWYHDEPGYLRDWRGHHDFGRTYYGRGGGGYRHR